MVHGTDLLIMEKVRISYLAQLTNKLLLLTTLNQFKPWVISVKHWFLFYTFLNMHSMFGLCPLGHRDDYTTINLE